MLIEGADANASVTGNESTVPMQLRITGLGGNAEQQDV